MIIGKIEAKRKVFKGCKDFGLDKKEANGEYPKVCVNLQTDVR